MRFYDFIPNNLVLGDRTSWEYHTISVTRVAGYGFGIAVSGGRDNPHFATGDPSIAVSDVLKGGPAEDRLQVNDRIISVNGVSLENVEYATAVQVLRDSGNTVTLVVKRRVPNINMLNPSNSHTHQHSNSLISSTGGVGGVNVGGPTGNGQQQSIKVVLSKSNKKDDFGIVLGCRLFVKEISSKARDQLVANGYTLQEGDVVTRIHNTNTNDAMSLKEARKIIDGCKERLNLVVLRDASNVGIVANNVNTQSPVYSHTAQVSNCSNPEEAFLNAGGANSSYSTQNLYVQPPTRPTPAALNTSIEDKSNLTPRGRSRGPITDVSLMQLDRPPSPSGGAVHLRSRSASGGTEDFYSSRRQLYEEDPLQRSKQPIEPRFISFQKEGSVGIRLTGGNEAGIFVTAVQPGSPASLQGLTPGDKILKVNDMDMHGVTREEAVLFLLSLQDRIDLIVQHCKDEYDTVVANQRGDSFHIKAHFHCDTPTKGEMAFKAGDVFRVVDTLHNGVVGSWQVQKIGRSHQEMQRGVIPNKSRAEELATAQFNATKKEMNASESRTSFFRRRRSSNHRRSKSLSRENWDDVVFSDSISKFPAYERVVLRHPGFVRPVVLFGPVADVARDRLIKDFPDKFTVPLQSDDKAGGSSKSAIIRLSNIRDIMDRGKHALLDITPNAVDRLNYAQFYPIVIFLKTDTKHTIKQLRQGIPKSAHKSSKKLLEQCQKLDRVWSHIFSNVIVLNEGDGWYRKLRDSIDQLQSGAVWMSETKPVESLSDDFLFPMNSSRLSYASSPESDLELSPGPSTSLSLGNLPQLVKSSSDPSIATNQDNLERDIELNNIGEGLMPPPYTNPYDHSATHLKHTSIDNKYNFTNETSTVLPGQDSFGTPTRAQPAVQMAIVPELPPRIDRTSKPNGVTPPSTLLPAANSRTPNNSTNNGIGNGLYSRSAHDRLFGTNNPLVDNNPTYEDEYNTRISTTPDKRNSTGNSLDRNQIAGVEKNSRTPIAAGKPTTNGSSYDSVSSYDSTNTAMQNLRLGPNAPDDLKSVPNVNGRIPPPNSGETPVTSPRHSIHHPESMPQSLHDHSRTLSGVNDLNKQNSPVRQYYDTRNMGGDSRNLNSYERRSIPQRPTNLGLEMTSPRKPQPPLETKTDYGKYSRNNSMSQADYGRSPKSPMQHNPQNGSVPFKPVPPPKPKNYRPPVQGNGPNGNMMNPNAQWENGEPTSPRNQNGFYYPSTASHYHHSQPPLPQQSQSSAHHGPPIHAYSHPNQYGGNMNGNYGVRQTMSPPQPPHYASNMNGYNGNQAPYQQGQYGMHRDPGYGSNIPSHHPSLDLAGSREQRGSAFELYRKPQIGTVGHHHNMSEWDHQQSYPHQSQMYYNEAMPANSQTRMMYDNQYRSRSPAITAVPPQLPPKSGKKKLLKSSLAAIKNALLKSTKPLRRQNSMIESRPKSSGLRRQHSMMEQRNWSMQSPQFSHRQQLYDEINPNPRMAYNASQHGQYYPENDNQMYSDRAEGIYDRSRTSSDNFYGQENLYANRALIEFERRTNEISSYNYEDQPNSSRSHTGSRIIRRHSMADRVSRESPLIVPRSRRGTDQSMRSIHNNSELSDTSHREEIYQTRSGAFMMQPNAPRPIRTREEEATYQSRREMHLDHLYQSKKEMQQRIHQGRIEVERTALSESPSSSSAATTPVLPDSLSPSRDSIYQTRKELKEKGFKTRTQLRDHIYQTRREAMESMAEPIYVSSSRRVEVIQHQEPNSSHESSSSPIAHQHRMQESISENKSAEENFNETQSPSVTKLLTSEDNSLASTTLPMIGNQNSRNSSNSDELANTNETATLVNPNQTELQETITPANVNENPSGCEESCSSTTPLSPRTDRSHISNAMRRVAPYPPPRNPIPNDANADVYTSRTSMETQYTSSQVSLPIGPPAAHSTPYASETMLENGNFPPLREQTTTHGVFDDNGGTLCDNVWNVSIIIPKGAIPPGVQQEIYFTVTDPRMSQTVGGPPLDMENGETMLSPLVMCGPQGLEFLVPVTLNIPHCASRTASLGLSLKATDSEKDLQTNWDNIELPSNTAAHTVSVKVDHF